MLGIWGKNDVVIVILRYPLHRKVFANGAGALFSRTKSGHALYIQSSALHMYPDSVFTNGSIFEKALNVLFIKPQALQSGDAIFRSPRKWSITSSKDC